MKGYAKSGSFPKAPIAKKIVNVLLWLWIIIVTAAYLHQFAFVIPLVPALFD